MVSNLLIIMFMLFVGGAAADRLPSNTIIAASNARAFSVQVQRLNSGTPETTKARSCSKNLFPSFVQIPSPR